MTYGPCWWLHIPDVSIGAMCPILGVHCTIKFCMLCSKMLQTNFGFLKLNCSIYNILPEKMGPIIKIGGTVLSRILMSSLFAISNTTLTSASVKTKDSPKNENEMCYISIHCVKNKEKYLQVWHTSIMVLFTGLLLKNKTILTKYCHTQSIWKLHSSFEIHWVRW